MARPLRRPGHLRRVRRDRLAALQARRDLRPGRPDADTKNLTARADVTMLAPEVFDAMMASLDIADESPELESLAALPRRFTP